MRSAIQRIALEHRRRYGYRRVTAELRRSGMRGKSQAGSAHHARGQPAGGAAQGVRDDHGFRTTRWRSI